MSRAPMSDAATTVSGSQQLATPEPRHNSESGLLSQIKRRLVRLGGGMFGAGTGTVEVGQAGESLVLPIVQDGEDSVNLIEITPWIPVKVFEPEDYDHVWCLVVDETRFTLDSAAEWIMATREANVTSSGRDLPTIALILRMDQLSAAELTVASSQLSPAGVLFTRWPERAVTVAQALMVIREQLQENYGEPNFDRQVRWGHAVSRHEKRRVVPAV